MPRPSLPFINCEGGERSGTGMADRRLSSVGVYSEQGLQLPAALSGSEYTIRDACLAITQLQNVIMDQNKTIQTILQELKDFHKERERVGVMGAEIQSIRAELDQLKMQCNGSSAVLNGSNSQHTNNAENVFKEMHERTTRAKNIIIHKVPESSAGDVNIRINHDKSAVTEILNSIEIDAGEFKSVRLGKPGGGARPLRVSFVSSDMARNCLRNRRKLVETSSNCRISADMTWSQRNHIKQLHQELDRRKQQGENDLVIRYSQGIPSITKEKRNSKNDNP